MIYEMKPGGLAEAVNWVLDQIQHREDERLGRRVEFTIEPPAETLAEAYSPPPPSLKRLRMGFAAFAEARAHHHHLGLWATDYMDGNGPRLRIRNLVAEPTNEVGLWEIEIA